MRSMQELDELPDNTELTEEEAEVYLQQELKRLRALRPKKQRRMSRQEAWNKVRYENNIPRRSW